MAKTIKFNLICDGKPIRTIEDLQQNFSIEDVLAYYHNGLLNRWLKVRDYADELEKVVAIAETEDINIIKRLIEIFGVSADGASIDEDIYILRYLEEQKELLDCYKQENFKKQSIIDDYATGYRQLVDGILQDPNNVSLIKANIKEIVQNYSWVLELDHRNLFNRLKDSDCVLAIMCLLMVEDCRKYYLPTESEGEDGTLILDISSNPDKKAMYYDICRIVNSTNIPKLKEILNKENEPELLKSFGQNTQQYPVFVEKGDKRYMIIHMDPGDRIAPFGSIDFIESEKTIGNFPIYNGIQYMSNNAEHTMYYMEV